MAYNEKLADRVRTYLADLPKVEEKEKMGGLVFMLDDKFCIKVHNDELLCRIDPATYEDALEQKGCREWIYKGKPMKGWVMVDADGTKNKKDLDYWIQLVTSFNVKAKSSKKKK